MLFSGTCRNAKETPKALQYEDYIVTHFVQTLVKFLLALGRKIIKIYDYISLKYMNIWSDNIAKPYAVLFFKAHFVLVKLFLLTCVFLSNQYQ